MLTFVVDLDGRRGEQQGAVQRLAAQGRRAELPGGRQPGLLGRCAPMPVRQVLLSHRHDGGGDGDGGGAGDDGQQRPQPAPGPRLSRRACPLGLQFLLGPGHRGGEEAPLGRGEVGGVFAGPVDGGVEPHAAVQIGLRAAALVPVQRGRGQVRPQPAALLVLVEPVGQPGPVVEQGLVGHLDGRGLDCDQPGRGERVDDTPGRLVVGGLGVRAAAADQHARLAGGQPQQHPARGGLLVRR